MMDEIRADMAEQLARVREMEQNGEITSAAVLREEAE